MGRIITIGREFGSGGHEIATKVANELGFKLFDKEMIKETAMLNGISESLVQYFDEKPMSLFDFTMNTNAIQIISSDIPLEQQIFIAQKNIMLNAIKTDDCIFVGRCSNYIFRNYENANSFFIVSPLEKRIERKMEILNINYMNARKEIINTDKKRAAYYKFYTGQKWNNILNYDYIINSGNLGIDESVNSIVNIIKNK